MAGKISLPSASGNINIVLARNCQSRKTPAIGAKNITLTVAKYWPLDSLSGSTIVGRNLLGMTIPVRITAGSTYQSYDGKRLVLEVGCSTVIFIQISPGNGVKHHHFFIQKDTDFAFDITTRAVAAIVTRDTKPLKTFILYEMYFLMGMFSTLGLVAWLAVTGSDVTVSILGNKKKMDAFNELASVWLVETEKIKVYAPTLYEKMKQVLEAEKNKLISNTRKELPKAVITDEKAQAQTAGILYGKYALSANSLSVWGAVSTVLIQATVKSATNIPDAAKEAFDKRYLTDVKSFANTDWYDVDEKKQAIKRLLDLFKSAQIPITALELTKIIDEVQKNPIELRDSLVKIAKAIKKMMASIH